MRASNYAASTLHRKCGRGLDSGGNDDELDLSDTGYDSDECTPKQDGDDLLINCPGRDNIIVYDFFDDGEIETIVFDDRVINSSFATRTATVQEKTTTQQPLDQIRSNETFDHKWNRASSLGGWQYRTKKLESSKLLSKRAGVRQAPALFCETHSSHFEDKRGD